ncbi:hypothetical protein SAMN05428944_4845 [Streptomyces sp. 1222.5]|uniref:hypothetical protein n=1 Tax=unclassified Streptomyces TaxID=2593676 RepID=UPI000895A566|nr:MULTISPECIES: hypothetical protein [unclassified Streptomyces]PKW08065.1 hypothetical protein BX260_3252 [Streptomyces sp. 5112.2]SEC72926.1 hypothetical protein SAMN05428944_4845 [Streptomyces sp. 1222.5]
MSTALPSWQDSKLGTMKRAALWLVQVVGEGNVFTKAELREAFPDVAQIDRRMRDLRDFGWKIDTKREDVDLDANEQRYAQRGEPVWEPGRGTRPKSAITVNQRRELLAAYNHKCSSCGATPGDTYADSEVTAQLDVAKREVLLPNGTKALQYVVECNRCRVGGIGSTYDVPALLSEAASLPSLELDILKSWIKQDIRTFSSIENVWAKYRALPAEAREAFRDGLA